MSKIVTLSNENITAKISSFGAEIISINAFGKERIWDGNPEFWTGHAPILFPFCGGLLDDEYVYDGKMYSNMPKHGFAKRCEFEVVSEEKTQATFLLEPSEEYSKVYPFDFKFRVSFKLTSDGVQVYYIVENHSNKNMPYNVGCHEAYALDGEFEDFYLKFEGEEGKITCLEITNDALGKGYYDVPLEENGLKLWYPYFNKEAKITEDRLGSGSLIFDDIKCKRVTLNKKGEDEVSIYFNDFKNLVVWTVPGAKFLAIEPWSGLPDLYDADKIIEHKKSIDILPAGETKTFYHSITFIK
ncbi:MAG: aldose 1-epimerase family protein [Clostridia bacterium]|nr:aldose 1-epimerase family protein [Clostridia bacterium]